MGRITEITKRDIYEMFRHGIADDGPFNLSGFNSPQLAA